VGEQRRFLIGMLLRPELQANELAGEEINEWQSDSDAAVEQSLIGTGGFNFQIPVKRNDDRLHLQEAPWSGSPSACDRPPSP
jgi:hypothetical protein